MRGRSTISVLALVLTMSAGAAWAFWSQTGTGMAAATTASLDAAAITAPSAAINSVTVTWSTQSSLDPTSAANSAITYSVERRLGAGAWAAIFSGDCSGAKPHGTTSCVDEPAAAGGYSYRAIANFHSWTATSNEVGPVTVTIDTTAPTVSSIGRADPDPTNAGSLRWSVTFSETVTGVGTTDFALAAIGISGASISSVTGSGATYTVTAATGSGSGTLGLNLVDDDSIVDALTNKLSGTGTGNGNLTGQTYTLDLTAPTISTIVRADATPTNAGSLRWTVTFSESVTGVGTGDFSLAATGVSGATISSVTGSGATYTVTAATGTGDGTLGLNLGDDDTIIDALTNKLGGTGTGNGNASGQTYAIDKTPPAAPATASVTSGVSPSTLMCSIASSTRFINNAGKGTVGVNATFTAPAPNAGDAIVFSISTPGSTAVTAIIDSSPPSTSVSTTLDLSSALFLDGAVTLTVRTRDLAGNLSNLPATGLTTIVIKDTVAPLTANYSATGGGALNLSPRVYGTAECGAFISAQKTTGGGPDTTTITSGTSYEIVVGLLALGSAYYDVTSTDLVGNTHTAIRVP